MLFRVDMDVFPGEGTERTRGRAKVPPQMQKQKPRVLPAALEGNTSVRRHFSGIQSP